MATPSNPAPRHAGRATGDFLPNLCSVQAVFHLVLVGELLAIALSLARSGLFQFSWYQLGALSLLIQWIVLASAALLCPLRPWLKIWPLPVAGAACYLTVLTVATALCAVAEWVTAGPVAFDWNAFLSQVLLAALFAGIVLRYFYLQQQLRNQQRAELSARIDALQARIRPHFLFNSMNSIASLIDFDPARAERMVLDLADLFRASLQEPSLIPLQQELDLCRRYADIETTRIGDRLRIDWDMDDVTGAEVPSLMLQPLLENAIYHGVEPLPGGGDVHIRVRTEGQLLRIDLTNPIASGGQLKSRGNGIALDNIRHRLQAYYGTHAELRVESDTEHYRVQLRLPRTHKFAE